MVRFNPLAVRRSRPRAGLSDASHWVTAPGPSQAQRAALMSRLPVRNQEDTSMCVGEVSSELLTLWAWQLGLAVPPFDEVYVYGKDHQYFDETQEGMEPVQALEVLQKFGDIPRSMDPIDTPTETVAQAIASITPAMDAEAARHRLVSGFGPLALGGNGLVGGNAAALSAAIDHFPILLAVPCAVSGLLFTPVSDGHGGYVAQWQPGSQVEGGHALLASDYRTFQGEFQVRCRNSWGPDYGMGGDVWLGGTYEVWEAWSMTCAIDPKCLWYRQAASQARQWEAAHQDIDADWRAALLRYASEQDALAAALGCPS